jgi:hypothetical protein
MPAKSQAQQKFMGIVHAIQKGDAKASDFSKDAQDAAKEMKPSDAKDFASTKHTGLPKKVGKEGIEDELKEIIRQTYRESLRESVNEDATELPQATIPSAVKVKLQMAIDKIKDAKLSNNAKLQLVAQVIDAIGVDKSQLSNIANKIRSKMESTEMNEISSIDGLNDVMKGQTSHIEGMKLSKGMAEHIISWMNSSPYGKKYNSWVKKNSISKILPIAFNWGLERGLPTNLKNEFVALKAKYGKSENESVNEIKKLPNGNFSIKKGYPTFADYEKHAKIGDTILKFDKRGGMIKTFVNGSELHQNAKKYLSTVHSIANDKINLSFFGKQGYASVPDYEKKEVGVLVLESKVNEGVSHEAMGIAKWTNTRQEAVQKFIDDNDLDAKEILKDVTKGGLVERVRFIQALVGTPGNSSFKWYVKNYANESVVTEGKKAFRINPPIGKAKYSISSHDGSSTHKDGSDFWDIKIFKNKVDLEKGIKDYKSKGFIEESVIKEGVYKSILSNNKGKLFFSLVDDETDKVTDVDAKAWLKSTIKDKSSDNSKELVLSALVRQINQFNKKVDFNMWVNANKPTWEEKVKYLFDKGLANNVNKTGIKVH